MFLLVNVLVENVRVAWLRVMYWSWNEGEEELVKKTRAKPGAGTGIRHESVAVSQLMVVTLRVPRKRPSTVKSLPRV